jgi:hypothetical protein
MITVKYNYKSYRPIVRYAFGASLLMAVAMGFDWILAFLLPVLSLSFLAPGKKPPDLGGGLFFVGSVALACLLGLLLAYSFLSMPPIHILVTFLLLFHIFYIRRSIFTPYVKVWLLIAILVIPNIALQSPELARIVAINLILDAVCAIFLIWIIFLLFPENRPLTTKQETTKAGPKDEPTVKERFSTALTSVLVIMPVYLVFYFAKVSNALVILVFIAILSMQPAFAKDFRIGKGLIIGNTMGGLAAMFAFEILTVVPEYGYLLLLVLLGGLIFGQQVFGKAPLAPVYGMAFSTFLLIIGSVTGSSGEDAGGKVGWRVLQIMIAVIYAVSAFGLIEKLKPRG